MSTLGMPPMGNHASTQLIPEKKMTPPDSKNPAANFASAFKNKVQESFHKYLNRHTRKKHASMLFFYACIIYIYRFYTYFYIFWKYSNFDDVKIYTLSIHRL